MLVQGKLYENHSSINKQAICSGSWTQAEDGSIAPKGEGEKPPF